MNAAWFMVVLLLLPNNELVVVDKIPMPSLKVCQQTPIPYPAPLAETAFLIAACISDAQGT